MNVYSVNQKFRRLETPEPKFPKVFYQFARGMVDLTPDYNSTNKDIALVALDNLPPGDRLAMLHELRSVFVELPSGRYSDRTLVDMLWTTGARVVPRHPIVFFKEALPILDRYIAKGGAPRRWGDKE